MNYLAASEAFFTNTLHSGYMLLNYRFNLSSLEGVGQLKVTNRTYTLCYFTPLIGTRKKARNHISRCKKILCGRATRILKGDSTIESGIWGWCRFEW